MNEANTCRILVEPKLREAGWELEPHSFTEQYAITAGRIVVTGTKAIRKQPLFADYLLRYTRDVALAVVEAKDDSHKPGDGLGQAKNYAEMLGLRFAYSTNGNGIVEFDYIKGTETNLDFFPTPAELWNRLRQSEGLSDVQAQQLATPNNLAGGRTPRYYQEIAINRTVQAIIQGKKRVLLTMATGTGKTPTAFQICWKLWTSGWNATGEHRKPRILYLADRNILVDDPKEIHFAPFGDARQKIENGVASKSREMYFSTYQSIAEDENRPGLYKQYAKDFFDLIVIDECHRGSARSDSTWREILEYFQPAYQLGLTATPKRHENADSYNYFGEPIYTYSLRQGIEDGFLAPYRVHRIVTTPDAVGYRPSKDEVDLAGNLIPDGEYHTKDFERVLAIVNRTQAIAQSITDFLKTHDRFMKTIVFCVDQEHALQIRQALVNLNSDLVAQYPNYVSRVTADEGDIGKGQLSKFQDLEQVTPVILTTSQLLTTGVDAPTVKNIVLARVINSVIEFKQIIGRGTRVREDYGKMFFNILDYTGTATTMFSDPDFDGEPLPPEPSGPPRLTPPKPVRPPTVNETPRKYYVQGGQIQIVAHLVYELDADGKQLRVVELKDYTAEKVRNLFGSANELMIEWVSPKRRAEVITALQQRGISFDELANLVGKPDADAFDLLCHLAYETPLRSRRQRTDDLRKKKPDFFAKYGPTARAILDELLDKYAEVGSSEFILPDVLKIPPISERGPVSEIAKHFGGAKELLDAVEELQSLLYQN